jgi:hypothetical protein
LAGGGLMVWFVVVLCEMGAQLEPQFRDIMVSKGIAINSLPVKDMQYNSNTE